MDKLQVIKVKYNGSMCRISAGKSTNGEVISFAALEGRLRSSFKVAPSAALVLTYSDVDGDVVNLSSDQDIVDALLYQQLNPLRVDLAVVESEVPAQAEAPVPEARAVNSAVAVAPPVAASAAVSPPAVAPPAASPAPAPAGSGEVEKEKLADLVGKQLKSVLGISEEVGRLAHAYEPLLKVAPGKIAEVLDAALKSGLSVSFEPVLEPSAGSWSVGSTATEEVEEQKEKDAAVLAALEDAAASVTMGIAVAGAEAAAAAAAATAGTVAACASEAAVDAAAAPPSLVVHNGIVCDGCGMSPVVGARYKSLVKHDYDLCEACFRKADADAADYKCLLQPVFRPRHAHFRGTCHGAGRQMRCGPHGPPGFGCRSMHHYAPGVVPPFTAPFMDVKLEARFVKDVTVPDNMEVLPGSRFTKIWRVRNTGSFPWPEHTQIVHIGGDMLGERNIVRLEVPSGGLLPEAELDVSVDMIAPSKLGRYMSHWRLCAPGGPKFGHRVWALIQVVAAPEANVAAVEHPVEDVQAAVPAAVEVIPSAPPVPSYVEVIPSAPPVPSFVEEIDPVVAAIAAAAVPEVAEAVEEKAERKAEEIVPAPSQVDVAASVSLDAAPAAAVEASLVGNFSLVDAPAVDVEAKVADAEAGSADGYVDASTSTEAASAPNGKAMNVANAVTVDVVDKASAAAARERMFDIEDEVEVEALDQLQSMGFEDRELNKAVLAQANGNLFSAIESLMLVAEWDPMLAELEEMGFDDEQLNKRVMFKNGGNMKGAVKELVHFYRAKEGQ